MRTRWDKNTPARHDPYLERDLHSNLVTSLVFDPYPILDAVQAANGEDDEEVHDDEAGSEERDVLPDGALRHIREADCMKEKQQPSDNILASFLHIFSSCKQSSSLML